MTDFLQNNDIYIEITAAILGLMFLYLEIIENKLMWFVGLLTSALYIFVFFIAKLYADMSLQFYYVVISIYGWIKWTQNKNKQSQANELKIKYLDKKTALILLLNTAVIYILIAYILVNFTNGSVPYFDAFTTALGIVATWMLAQKIIEQWLVWVVANAVSTALYIYKGLYPTSVLFLVYTVLAILGYYQWKKAEIFRKT